MTRTFARINYAVRILAILTALLVGLLLARVHGQEIQDAQSLQSAEVEFDHHWGNYLMAEFGCPVATGTLVVKSLERSECREQPRLLADEKARARELAKTVFGLVEPNAQHK
jgi:hypothetical protein